MTAQLTSPRLVRFEEDYSLLVLNISACSALCTTCSMYIVYINMYVMHKFTDIFMIYRNTVGQQGIHVRIYYNLLITRKVGRCY